MAGYSKKDASEDTGDPVSKVSETWHQARDDATSAGELEERNVSKVSDSEDGPKLYEALKESKSEPNNKNN